MITSPRSLSRLASLLSTTTRRTGIVLASTVALLAAMLLAAAPAGALIAGSFGVQERATVSAKVEPLQYHQGPVVHASDAYAIYWDPLEIYNSEWKRLIDQYFQDVGAASGTHGDVFALNAQYGETGYSNAPTASASAKEAHAANQSTFRGAYTDKESYPTECNELAAVACVTDTGIKRMLTALIKSGKLPGATGTVPGAASTPVYYVLTPPGVTVCTDSSSPSDCSYSEALKKEAEEIEKAETGICGYHSWTEPEHGKPVVYAVQPWIAGDAGLFVESWSPLKTSGTSADVLACQDNSTLEEPNQLGEINPFANYGAGLADVIINDLSIEQSNIVVDPLLNGWYQTGTGAEQSDICQRWFGPLPESPPAANKNTHAANLSSEELDGIPYYMQWTFNSSGLTTGKGGGGCWQGADLEPHFTAPSPVNVGDIVGFDAEESGITLDANTTGLPSSEPYAAPIYAWNFGDGSVASGTGDASEFHSYAHGGTYNVTLTVTDGGGNTESFAEPITVSGPAEPSPSTENPSGSSAVTPNVTAGSSSATTTGSATATPAKPVPGPVASAAVTTHSLKSALKKGLKISYSVNEQVAGQFQVLLASNLAKRIGLHGARATGLAPGTPPEIVIGKAILVTTKGGRNTVKIKFGKKTAAKLRKLRRVPLTIRLIVRNASSHSPLTTTVISTVTLSR